MGIVRDFPLFGVGLDGFQYIFPVYRSYGGAFSRTSTTTT